MKKNLFRFLPLIGLLLFGMGCTDLGKGGNCLVAINDVLPDSNPSGYEVLIVGQGFSTNTEVFFNGVASPLLKLQEGLGLIALVPNGISSPVQITVQEGDCLARQDGFTVFSTFPSNVPKSPVNIVIPTLPGSFPNSIDNEWVNVFDREHRIGLFTNPDKAGVLADFSQEFHDSNEALNGNPITGTFQFTNNPEALKITIKRKPQNGGDEQYTGRFIDPKVDPTGVAEFALLLTSKKTGRQLVIVR